MRFVLISISMMLRVVSILQNLQGNIFVSSNVGRVVKENTMPMDAGDIEKLIKQALPDATVTIRDLAGDGDHYAAEVVSESFRGKTRVAQHKMVYDALQGNMGGVLHALALQTSVPE